MKLTNEQANRIYAAFGLNAVAVKQAVMEASQAVPTMEGHDSHVLALVLGWFTAHENEELVEGANRAVARLRDILDAQDNDEDTEVCGE
jgi:hypothetical protein